MSELIENLHKNPSFQIDFDHNNSNNLIASPQVTYSKQKALELCDHILLNKKSIIYEFIKCYLIKNLNCHAFQKNVDLIFKSADRNDSPNFYDELTSNWISLLNENTQINSILFIGTHNACSYKVCWHKKPLFLEQKALFGLVNVVRFGVEKWVCNQNCSIEEQFKNGVRLFDIRLSKDDSNIYFISHSFYLCELEEFLSSIGIILKKYPKEIIVINFKIDFAFRDYINNEDIESIFSLVKAKLGEFILPSSVNINNLTIRNCTKQLIVYFNGSLHNSRELIRLQRSHELWPEATTNEDMLIRLNEKLNYYIDNVKQHEFIYASFNTTPDKKEIIKGVFKLSDLIKRSQNLQSLFSNFLRNAQYIPNGFIFDAPSQDTVFEILKFNFNKSNMS